MTEQIGREIEEMTRKAFHSAPSKRTPDHTAALRAIGRQDTEVMLLRESLMSVERLLGFLTPVLSEEKRANHRRALKSAQRDVRTITDQANFLSQKTALLLDATLGMIQIGPERNRQAVLDRRHRVPAVDADRLVLGDELSRHAAAGLPRGILGHGGADAGVLRGADPAAETPRLVLMPWPPCISRPGPQPGNKGQDT